MTRFEEFGEFVGEPIIKLNCQTGTNDRTLILDGVYYFSSDDENAICCLESSDSFKLLEEFGIYNKKQKRLKILQALLDGDNAI